LFQRLLCLGDEPRVLDRNRCLIGKGRDQLDLLFSKRLDTLACKSQHSNRYPVAHQRHGKSRPYFSKQNSFRTVTRLRGHIVDVNCSAKERSTGANAVTLAARVKAARFSHECLVFGREAAICREPINFSLAAVDEDHFRAA